MQNTYIVHRKNASIVFKAIAMLAFLFLGQSSVFAQRPFGNEWIQYDQPYYKIKIGKDGVYRLSYNDLKDAGIDMDVLESQTLQMYWRGKQIPIYVEGEADNKFDNSDYIEFFGRHNDGALDSVFYVNPKDQSHTFYSTYTDTSAYFLTWGYWEEPLRVKNYNYVSGLGNAANTIIDDKLVFYKEVYQDGAQIDPVNNFYTPEYTLNEGWQSKDISLGRFKDTEIPTLNADNSSPIKPVLEFRINSRSDYWLNGSDISPDHYLVVEIKPKNGTFRKVYENTYNGFKTNIKNIPVEWSDLGASTIVRVSSKGVTGVPSDIHTIAYIRIKYAKKLNTALQLDTTFQYSGNQNDTFAHFAMYAGSGVNASNYRLLDVTNGFNAMPKVNGDSVYFSLKSGNNAEYYLYDESLIENIPLSSVTFGQIDLSEDYNYLIITHKNFWSAAHDFAAYKETKQLDSATKFKVNVADVENLYDEYFYGVKSPAAIQNFSNFIYKKQAHKPDYMFLIGKGNEVRSARALQDVDFVPAIGQPASELLYVAGIDNGFSGYDHTLNPNIAVGRLAVRTPEEAQIYLTKLKAYDSMPPALWKKEFVHVGGGLDYKLQQLSKHILNDVKAIAEGPNLGANVHSYFAETADPVNRDKKAAIQKRIEQGVGVLTYFGHAAGEQLGVEFADPNTLANHNKYPIFYLNGCNVGNPSIPNKIQMDQYMFGKDKGTVSWISHSNLTLTSTLEIQMKRFYNYMAQNKNFANVGDAWKQALDFSSFDPNERAAAFAWVIQGDPALNFPFLHVPDYIIAGNIMVNPNDVVANSPDFSLNIPVANQGKTDTQQITLSVKHTFPDGSTHIYDKLKMVAPLFADTIAFNIKNNIGNLQGLNKFEIYVDSDSSVTEADETNNSAQFEYYFPGTGVRSLFPLNYSIASTNSLQLTAQSRDLFDTVTEMYFEIDTIPQFNSPYRKSSGLIKGNNLATWQPALLSKDSTVYYWRVRLNLPADSGGFWETRSFTYIKGSPEGWSQGHFPQFSKVELNDLIMDTVAREFKFRPFYNAIQVFANPFWPGAIKPEDDLGMTCGINPRFETIALMVFDRTTLHAVDTLNPRCTGAGPAHYRGFKMTTPEGRAAFVSAVNNIKDGNYIALLSVGAVQQFKDWEPEVFEAFDKLGSEMMRNLSRDSVAFVLAGIKQPVKGQLLDEDFKIDDSITTQPDEAAFIRVLFEGTNNVSGNILSEPIGKATKWKTLYYAFEKDGSADRVHLQIIGIDTLKREALLADNIIEGSYDLSAIDAEKYPLIKLKAFVNDTLQRTPPQLKYWTVLYEGVPEGTLLIDDKYAFNAETNQQGDSIQLNIKFENIYIHPFREMLVSYSIYDETNKLVKNNLDTFPALQPNESFYISKKIPTSSLDGNYNLIVRVNPDFQQPEETLDNNIYNKYFSVISDISNPLLDVTFDQRHIRNGEIVSANTSIAIKAMDENSTILLDDTALFSIKLIIPEGDTQNVYFNSEEVNFSAGTIMNNTANITYMPGPLADGIYGLIVKLKDGSGNTSGSSPYQISFRVVNKPAISNLYVYPNPVTSSAKFVFTLTGNEVPQINGIEIYNLTGKLVTVISGNSWGKMHIGTNEIYWNGTNTTGAKLTNGMYFYKLNISGNALPQYAVPEDKLLNKGYGKLILLQK